MSARRKPTLIDHLASWVVLTAAHVVGRLPIQLTSNLFALLGTFVFYCIPVRRAVVLSNLEIAFGSSHAPEERRRIAHATYRHIAMLVAEVFSLWSRGPDWARAQIVDRTGFDEFIMPMVRSGKKFLCITGHFGNWELLGASFGVDYPITAIAKPLHNPVLNDRLAKLRQRYGLDIISTADRFESGNQVFNALQSGRLVCITADQDARRAGVFVPFFKRAASTFTGPALFAIRHKMPIVPVFLVRLGPGRHRVVVCKPIHPVEGMPLRAAIEDMTRRHVAALEDVIRLNPTQYFWFHRRWKTSPKPPKPVAAPAAGAPPSAEPESDES